MREVQLKGITKKYDNKVVLDDLDMSFAPSLVHVLRGQSGSGKTTLLRILEGLEQPDAGTVSGLEDVRISVLFQEDRLCANLSVLSNITLVLADKSEKTVECIEADLEELGLKGCAQQPARTLSGGMKRKVSLLRALYAESDVLFLDEPLAGLDEKSRVDVVQMVQKKRNGRMIFWVSHLKQDLSLLGEHMEYELQNGKLTVGEIKNG